MFDPRDESAATDVISSGEALGTFLASRWPRLARGVRSWRGRVLGVAVVAGGVAAAALLIPGSPSAGAPAPPGQPVVITNTAVRPDGWMGSPGAAVREAILVSADPHGSAAWRRVH